LTEKSGENTTSETQMSPNDGQRNYKSWNNLREGTLLIYQLFSFDVQHIRPPTQLPMIVATVALWGVKFLDAWRYVG
jgi:hypothetical protein